MGAFDCIASEKGASRKKPGAGDDALPPMATLIGTIFAMPEQFYSDKSLYRNQNRR
jgi:hypothetical protein